MRETEYIYRKIKKESDEWSKVYPPVIFYLTGGYLSGKILI